MSNDERTPPGMLLYTNGVAPFMPHLSDEQAGRLFRGLYCYHVDGVVPEFDDPFISAAFAIIKQGIDDGRERYGKKVAGGEYGVYVRKERTAGREPLSREEWEQQTGESPQRLQEDRENNRRMEEFWNRLNAPS